MNTTPYQMAVNNVAREIRENAKANLNRPNNLAKGPNAFDASFYLGLAFCKPKEEVIMDIIQASGE